MSQILFPGAGNAYTKNGERTAKTALTGYGYAINIRFPHKDLTLNKPQSQTRGSRYVGWRAVR